MNFIKWLIRNPLKEHWKLQDRLNEIKFDIYKDGVTR